MHGSPSTTSVGRVILQIVFVASVAASAHPPVLESPPSANSVRALALADRLVTCNYSPVLGVFDGEALWQSGNTIESLSNLIALCEDSQQNASRWVGVLASTFANTPVIVDNCFDDHQWWLLAWLRAYQVTSNVTYLQRAGQVFDYVADNGWTEWCGGGVLWCPTGSPYKNAITNELFLSAAMGLHPYVALLDKPASYYLDWAQREWRFFEGSGLINEHNLINDGLDGQCRNNNETTWTYNQGVLLNGLAALGAATGNATIAGIASLVAAATMTSLTTGNGVLSEPCTSCDGDQDIFKGVFMRHLGYLTSFNTTIAPSAHAYILSNAASVLSSDACPGGGYGLLWQGPCNATSTQSTATASAALDLLLAAARVPPGDFKPPVTTTTQTRSTRSRKLRINSQPHSGGVEGAASTGSAGLSFAPLGVGNCADAHGEPMPNCYMTNVSEQVCAAATQADSKAVAYDFEAQCLGTTFCRVRTLSGPSSCSAGWMYGDGAATNVTTTTAAPLTLCVLKTE